MSASLDNITFFREFTKTSVSCYNLMKWVFNWVAASTQVTSTLDCFSFKNILFITNLKTVCSLIFVYPIINSSTCLPVQSQFTCCQSSKVTYILKTRIPSLCVSFARAVFAKWRASFRVGLKRDWCFCISDRGPVSTTCCKLTH